MLTSASLQALAPVPAVGCCDQRRRPAQLPATKSGPTLSSPFHSRTGGIRFWPHYSKEGPCSRRLSAQGPRAAARAKQSRDEHAPAAVERAGSHKEGSASERWSDEVATPGAAGQQGRPSPPHGWLRGAVLPALAAVALSLAAGAVPALAADPLKTCACLLSECRAPFFRCLADPGCAANVACLNTCNNRPDETECQIGCGDLFEDAVVDEFNKCAVSEKKCVPQKPDTNLFPRPAADAIVPEFDMKAWDGTWFISAGLNRTFDTFDCQEHAFRATDNKIEGSLKWRIATPEGGFFTRSAKQVFVQDGQAPGLLLNHGNEFLHYEDDWYILSSKTVGAPDDYILVYYRGRNDAWDGYGGAVIYTRARTLPQSVKPALQTALQKVNLSLDKFKETDNSCRPQAPLLARLEKTAERAEEAVVGGVVGLEEKVVAVTQKEGELFANLAKRLFGEVVREEEELTRELGEEEKALLKQFDMGVRDIEKLFGKPLPVRKIRSGGAAKVLPASAKQGEPTATAPVEATEAG